MKKSFLVTTLVLLLLLFLFIGVIVIKNLEQFDWTDCWYLMMTTSSTVGFGNVAPRTSAGKLFISFYQFIPIVLFLTLLASAVNL